MKSLLAIFISSALAISGYAQTRNVLVGTNNTVVQPTNFWSVDASNARVGLGLGSAATNPASAFQPSSGVLSNLASSNAINLTNLRATNIVGVIPSSNIPTVTLTNISGTLVISQGGTGATNAGQARTNLGATTIGNALFTATNSAAAIDAIGISTNFSDQLLSVSNIEISTFPAGSAIGFVVPTSGQTLFVRGTNVSSGTPAFFGWDGFVQTAFSAAQSRTNLGLNSWVTNTNSPVFVSTNGEVVSPTNFWQVAPIQTLVQDFTLIGGTQTNNATNARNVYVYSLNTNLVGVSNTIILPTNVSTFNGDQITVVHKGTTNTTTVVRQAGSTNNFITLNKFDESVKFIRELGQWDFYHNISFVEPIQFSGTNAVANVAESRTNLGLGITNEVQFGRVFVNGVFNTLSNAVEIYQPLWIGDRDSTNAVFQFETSSDASIARTNLGLGLPAITNTSNTTFQQAIFTTNAAPTNTANVNGIGFNTAVAWMSVSIVTNGVTNSYRIPLFQ